MQGMIKGVRTCQEILKGAILKHHQGRYVVEGRKTCSRFGCFISSSSSPTEEKGLENISVAEVLMTKGDDKVGSWLCCRSDDTVEDAVKNMAQHNIGSLVVLKPGEQQHIAGIFTEREKITKVSGVGNGGLADYLRKIVGQGRSPKYTRVAEIMTDENKLITLPSDANILHAMQLMTDKHIRHVPVIDGRIVGMISIVDVVRAVVEQQKGELKRLNEFIRGEYY
ncbi:cystathionine beta-synthase (CBS) family protein [Citrus sinensis]|uniref:Cystathionine beta-synthase (CBS) family protein n=1 Tax=Citrus sinensis TaxID=2711 RepID=A0ACB8KWU6_CITSI|nr:cystathionine beta-synthase (CBS) family protein [Citrus sinensis]